MTILLVLLGLLIIMVLLRLFVGSVNEGFQTIPLNPEVIQGYNNFLGIYNPFCANWKKAIVSSVASEIPQQPLTDPSQVQGSQAPDISDSQLNEYITQLSQQLGQPLPPICSTMPTTIDSNSLATVIPMIPTDLTPIINALNWMNKQLAKSQDGLGNALKGIPNEGFLVAQEGFDNMCQDISQCLANDPQLMQQLAQGVANQEAQNVVQQEHQLMSTLIPFFSTPALSAAYGVNVDLMEKAQQIQDQAQSGELVNQINVPGGNTVYNYEKPPGANNLSEMQQNNPERYNELKQNYGMWFTLKQMLENINSNL